MKEIKPGASLTREIIVTKELLAISVGSGNVHVYATPMMLALMEGTAASLLASFLEGDETSVGVRIFSSHLAATPEGMKVTATAEITAVDGRKVSFCISAADEKGPIGEGTHERVIVYRERFEQKALSKLD